MGSSSPTLVHFLRKRPVSEDPTSASLKGENAPRIPALQLDIELEKTFWCFAKLRAVPLGQCLDSYVSHTARKVSPSNCTNCSQGEWNRYVFAQS